MIAASKRGGDRGDNPGRRSRPAETRLGGRRRRHALRHGAPLLARRRSLPRYDEFEKNEMVDRAKLAARPARPGCSAPRCRRNMAAPAAPSPMRARSSRRIGHVGVDGFGIALHNAIVAPYILHYGSEEQKQQLAAALATGELIGAIAMTEPGAGSDLQGIKTTRRAATATTTSSTAPRPSSPTASSPTSSSSSPRPTRRRAPRAPR